MLSSCCLQDECTAHRCLCFTIHTSALGRPDRAVVYFTYGLVHGSPWLYLGGLETGPSWRKRVNGNWGPSSRLSVLLPSLQNWNKDLPCAPATVEPHSPCFPATRDQVPINCDPQISSSTLELFLPGVLLGDKATRR